MKKVLRFWIWLFLFSLSPVTTSAQVQRFVPKQEALSIAQGQFRGQDVDYYILDDSTSSTWNIFVDAEPMKGWQHDSYIIKVPKLLGPNSGPIQKIQQKNPPLGNYVPLLVKNRYGGYANSKPHVAKPVSANEESDVATGSINLEGNDGIKAVATPTAKSLEVTLKRPAPTGAMVTVTSVVDGGSKVTSGMPEGAEAITLDVSGLSNGVYVVSYSINSEQIDQKKVNIN